MFFHIKSLSILILSLFLITSIVYGAERSEKRVAILVSLNIRPYIEAVEGLKKELSDRNPPGIDTFNMENYTDKNRDVLAESLANGKYDLCIAVGPEAFRYVQSIHFPEKVLKIYTMVLNPDEITNLYEPMCGISLDIPAKTLMQIFSQAFPSLKRIGLLYDPKNNSEFVKQVTAEAAIKDLNIIPIEIPMRKEISTVLKANWMGIDGLWLIPDRTIITESLVPYIIKEAISNGVAVFGYNRFFYKNGAALCYILDYSEIGKKTAQLSLAMLNGSLCRNLMPAYEIWYNPRILKILKIDMVTDPSSNIKITPGP